MALVKSEDKLHENFPYEFFTDILLSILMFFDYFSEISSLTIFHDKVEGLAFFVNKVLIVPNNIFVFKLG